MRRRPAAGDTIIDDRWTAGDDKEGSGQEQTTTNHCALKEEEDYHNNEEEDCAAASTAAATAVAAAAAVTAARRSGLRRGAVAAAVDSRIPSLFLLNVRYTWHKIPVHLSFPPDSDRIPSDFGQINLALEDLIPTCVPRDLTESAESGGFRSMRPVRNGKKTEMHNLGRRWASPISMKDRGQHTYINFYINFMILLKLFDSGVEKIYAEGRPPLQRHGFITFTPLEG